MNKNLIRIKDLISLAPAGYPKSYIGMLSFAHRHAKDLGMVKAKFGSQARSVRYYFKKEKVEKFFNLPTH